MRRYDVRSLFNFGRETSRDYREMDSEMIKLIGFDIKTLVKLFAAGYTLQPPTTEDD